jgi:DNA-binding MarR family transcriptional regulator
LPKENPLDRALACFPKLYYYAPNLPKFIKVSGRNVNVKAPRDAILWLLDELAKDSGEGYCLNADLQDLIQRNHPGLEPPGFTRLTRELSNEGLITKSLHRGDDLNKHLALTKKGHEVLAAIKKHRRENSVAFLFEGLSPKEKDMLAHRLEMVAKQFWPKIKEAITQPAKRRKKKR